MTQDKKRTVGVTGGVGAGKSSVLAVLESDFNAKVILADLVAHDLMEPGSEGLKRVVDALGDSFLKADGSVDRKKLAELIFHDDKARETMNSIIHPLAWRTIREAAEAAKEPLVVVEAAVFDTAPPDLFDEIWYIDTTKENRIARLMADRGYSREKCESIIASQESGEEYRRRCARVIDNNGDIGAIRKQLEEILKNEIS